MFWKKEQSPSHDQVALLTKNEEDYLQKHGDSCITSRTITTNDDESPIVYNDDDDDDDEKSNDFRVIITVDEKRNSDCSTSKHRQRNTTQEEEIGQEYSIGDFLANRETQKERTTLTNNNKQKQRLFKFKSIRARQQKAVAVVTKENSRSNSWRLKDCARGKRGAVKKTEEPTVKEATLISIQSKEHLANFMNGDGSTDSEITADDMSSLYFEFDVTHELMDGFGDILERVRSGEGEAVRDDFAAEVKYVCCGMDTSDYRCESKYKCV